MNDRKNRLNKIICDSSVAPRLGGKGFLRGCVTASHNKTVEQPQTDKHVKGKENPCCGYQKQTSGGALVRLPENSETPCVYGALALTWKLPT